MSVSGSHRRRSAPRPDPGASGASQHRPAIQYVEQPHATFPAFIGRFAVEGDVEATGKATVSVTCCYRMVEPSGCIAHGLVDEPSLAGVIVKKGNRYLASVRRDDDGVSEVLEGRFRTCRDALQAIADAYPTLQFE